MSVAIDRDAAFLQAIRQIADDVAVPVNPAPVVEVLRLHALQVVRALGEIHADRLQPSFGAAQHFESEHGPGQRRAKHRGKPRAQARDE